MTVVKKITGWQLSDDRTAAQHTSGLTVALDKKWNNKGVRPAIDIKGLERLAGTEWSRKVGELVRQGLYLVEGNRA